MKDVSATDLAVHAGNATLAQVGLSPEKVDHVVIGQVAHSGPDSAYMARHVALKMKMPVHTPAYSVNRLCGSGFQSWVNAYQMIRDGEAECVLAGGAEQMSQIPYILRNVRFGGMRMGPGELEDGLNNTLTDAYAGVPMAITAENLGEKYGISREECDQHSMESQSRCKAALDRGIFKEEMKTIQVQSRKGAVDIAADEHPKPGVAVEKIRAMKPLFKENGLVTAATASGIVDGAACSLLCSESFAKKNGLKPLARILSYASVGCEPGVMGIGPAPASRKALQRAGLELKDMNLIEVNEAFSAQYLAVVKELGLDRKITNVHGGAIAIGHPLGASGTRIMNHLVYELGRRQQKYGLGTACIGGGQGIALVIERL